MKIRWSLQVLALVLLLPSLTHAVALGTISSLGPVELSGTKVSNIDKTAMPVPSGAEIGTTLSMAVIRLLDNSVITLDKNSRAQLVTEGDQTRLVLLKGAANYRLSSTDRVQIYAFDRPVMIEGNAGRVAIQNQTVTTSILSPTLAQSPTPTVPKPEPKPEPKSKGKKSSTSSNSEKI